MRVISRPSQVRHILEIIIALGVIISLFIFPEFYKLLLLLFIFILAIGAIRFFRDGIF